MLFSIGYATKTITVFIEHLQRHKINAIADVRSVPYSKVFTDYRQENIVGLLKEAGIKYVYLGGELGPRSKDPAHYDEQGQVQYQRLAKSTLFNKGKERLQLGLRNGLNIALMCAEKDPTNCHRSLLIAYYLKQDLGIDVQHIHHDGSLEPQTELEQRLVSIQELSPDLLTSADELQEIAYRKHIKQTSYTLPDCSEQKY